MEKSKAISLYIKDESVRNKMKEFCEKNHITVSEFTTLLYREFFETESKICISNDEVKIIRS